MPVPAVRARLANFQPHDNTGLSFRCALPVLPVKGSEHFDDRELDKRWKKEHLDNVARVEHSPEYEFYFKHLWQPLMNVPAQSGEETKILRFGTNKRLITGLAEASPIENGFAFDRIYGVPILRGSSWKGLARRTAWHRLGADDKDPRWAKGGEYDLYLFGGADADGHDQQGAVCFGDALPVPGSWKLVVDVLTPHGEKLWDPTNPVNFFSVEGEFALPLRGVRGWIERAAEIVTEAVQTEGFGAKTSSGFGRMELQKETL